MVSFSFAFGIKGRPKVIKVLGEKGQVGILPRMPDNTLKVVIKASGWPNPLFELTDSDHIPSRFLGNIIVKKLDADERRVRRNDHSINRQVPGEFTDSFKWVIDFENNEMHDVKLNKDRRILRPRLIFKDGTFCTKLVNNCAQWLIKKDSEGNEISRDDFGHVAKVHGSGYNDRSRRSFIRRIRGGQSQAGRETQVVQPLSMTSRYLTMRMKIPLTLQVPVTYVFYEHYLTDEDGFTFEFEPKVPSCRELRDGQPLVQPFVCYGTTGDRTSQIE